MADRLPLPRSRKQQRGWVILSAAAVGLLLLIYLTPPRYSFPAREVGRAGSQGSAGKLSAGLPQGAASTSEEKLQRVAQLVDEPANPENYERRFPLTLLLVSLLVVLGAVYGCAHLLGAAVGKRVGSGNGLLHLAESRPLSGDRWLHLVVLGSKLLLIGCGGGGVALLKEIEDPAAAERLRQEGRAGLFDSVLARMQRSFEAKDRLGGSQRGR